eukprot:scaffold8552_cov114-Skeletonema_menzelii.AAC.1
MSGWYRNRLTGIVGARRCTPAHASARQRTWRDVRNTPCTAAFSRFLALTPAVGVNPELTVNARFTPTCSRTL